MDRQCKAIIDYSREIGGKIGDDIREAIKKRIADILFVSFSAMESEPVKIARKSLLPSSGKLNSTVWFTGEKAAVDVASFINGIMTRYLDYNDTYLSKEAMHPSDNIPPLISAAEALDLKGNDVMDAIGQAYATACAFSDAFCIRDRGWDHVTYISISSAAGLGKLLSLDEEKYENLISLSINNSISMRQTRAGNLSMWKGATAADACRNSVFAMLLARNGFTGPSPIFSGEMGFFKQVTGNIDVKPDVNLILKTHIKNYPVEYHAMSAAEAALDLRSRIKGKIHDVKVETFTVGYNIIVKDPEKWAPQNKETADHSLPYIVCYSLIYGTPSPDSYSKQYLKDASIADLMKRTEITVADKYDRMYPEKLPAKVRVTTDQDTFEKEVIIPRGHSLNPFSWEDLREKGARTVGPDATDEIIKFVRDFEKRDIKEFVEVTKNVNSKR